ncbi:metal ABC transporter permease [Desulfovibrio desulfuricans]|uniref:Metal ABC transporter permease n=1 Tax=Desulfovibrio desulfuricans TaxID=876 RepID=A0A4P7UIT1_DESDE|nr:metal ABC transporter permease [Desulfovibrio desulfuricans]QCC85527.1 metal ABC transporter permease [Desulfovibrio desulfuricans]
MDDFFHYAFLQRALLMAVLGGSVCGAMGVFVVLWRMSLVGMCVSHAAFAGALVALWLGAPPLAGGLAASLGAASAVGPLAQKPGLSLDTAMGVVFSVVMSLAMLALGLMPGARTEGLSLIWGSLLTVTGFDLQLMSGTALLLFGFIFLFFKEIEAIMGQRRAAAAAGIPVRGIHYACLALMGLVVAFALKAIGGLLIYALIVTPAATALQLTYRLSRMFLLSALFGIIACVSGLWLSFHWAVPPGAVIVLVSCAMLMAAMAVSPKKTPR